MITVHFDKDIHKCADAFNSGNSQLDSFIKFVTLASTQSGYKLYKRFGFDELEDDMHLAPEKDEIGCTPMDLSLDWEE